MISKRPRPTLRLLLYALLDVAGVLLLASGAMWLARGETLFLPGFPTGTASALITVVAGVALMLQDVAGIFRALMAQAPASNDSGRD